MYWLMSLNAVVRIAFGLMLLFVVIPALAAPRTRSGTLLERFFWNFGVGIIVITLFGQILSLANLFSLLTVVLGAVLIILVGRSSSREQSPWHVAKSWLESSVLAVLNMFDGRVHVFRRVRRTYRRFIGRIREKTATPSARWQIAAWTSLGAIAAALRFYRPLASANLGFSDTYVHLYLVKLLEQGAQVDPDWGPYPRGMHFLLLTLHYLTNVDQILLMNFFGAFMGVLMTLAVAESTRQLTRNVAAGLLAGFLFATLVGGPGQYFILGGAFTTDDPQSAGVWLSLPYDEIEGRGEFDLALTAFHRQTSTLSQELAITLLFPAVLFLLTFLRTRSRWHLVGYAGCTAAIAAAHSGVVIPLAIMSMLAVLGVAAERSLDRADFRRALIAGVIAVLIGSSWMLAFIVYPYAGGDASSGEYDSVRTAALYYFPFLRTLRGEPDDPAARVPDDRVFVRLTPLLAACGLLALTLLALSAWRPAGSRGNLIWIASVFLVFLLLHLAATLGLPRIVETTRNSQWFLMSMVVLLGTGVSEMQARSALMPRLRVAAWASVGVLVLAWLVRVPLPSSKVIQDRLVNYSGYGASALAVLRIARTFEPYTWTLVSYGQEFPMVLRRGFHVPAADFLETYDPGAAVTPIPTRHLFIIVEKTPHPFQINAWARRFDRTELEKRLQTWVFLYRASHSNVRIFLEDDHVRVYHIERSPEEIDRLASQGEK